LGQKIIEVAVPVPLRKQFCYIVPEHLLAEPLSIGQPVVVPFSGRKLVAIVTALTPETDVAINKLKQILAIYPSPYTLPKSILSLLELVAKYYHHPIGDVMQLALPVLARQVEPPNIDKQMVWQATEIANKATLDSLSRAKKQQALLATLIERPGQAWSELRQNGYTKAQLNKLDQLALVEEVSAPKKQPFHWQNVQPQGQLTLSKEQAVIVAAIKSAQDNFSCHLVDGVTGSGKTEVYLQAMENALSEGNQVLVMVPEIGLTPQTISRFRSRFDVPIFVNHSGMNDKERLQTWLSAKEGMAAIVIGTRSTIFCPLPKLALIIVDEEHDSSFKQQDSFRYQARDLAVLRAKQSGIPVILGSATPSLETLHKAWHEQYHYHELKNRAGASQMSTIELIDCKLDKPINGLSSALIAQIKTKLERGEQVLLFLNRRGYAPALNCNECHHIIECQRCNKPYTFHQSISALICHHCGSQKRVPKQCGECGSVRLDTVGIGTEQLEQQIAQLFGDFSAIRIDRDSTRKKGAFDSLLEEIQDNKHQVLIGTQMLAKGHHFPNVTLVGILDVDGALFSFDFRAAEYMAQLLTQVAGRAGRASKKGHVAIQTYHPEHPLLQDLVNNGYQHFAKFALTERKIAKLPPYSHQALFRAEASYPSYPEKFLRFMASHYLVDCEVAGPIPASMAKKAGKYRYHLILQSSNRQALHQACAYLLQCAEQHEYCTKVRWSLDIDPTDFSW